MRYRMLDILVCPDCGGDLSLRADQVAGLKTSQSESFDFVCARHCFRFNKNAQDMPTDICRHCYDISIEKGALICDGCRAVYPIDRGVPDLSGLSHDDGSCAQAAAVQATDKTYSVLWESSDGKADISQYHFTKMQEVIPEKVVRGRIGLEVGCGPGMDARAMALETPAAEIVTIDISAGAYVAAHFNKNIPAIHVVRCSALKLPFRRGTFDFCYSFGVIHHTPDPRQCFREVHRVLSDDAKAFVYLYEDHEDNVWKRYPLMAVTGIRRVTSGMDRRLLYLASVAASPLIFLVFTVPAKILNRFKRTRRLADHIPFNFGTGPFSLHGDLYDRFGAPVEFRFNRTNLGSMLKNCGFKDMQFTRLKTSAGLVAWATNTLPHSTST